MLKGLTHAFYNKTHSFFVLVFMSIHYTYTSSTLYNIVNKSQVVRASVFLTFSREKKKIRKIVHSTLNLIENLLDTFRISLQFDDGLLFKVKHVHRSAIRLVTN